MDSGILSRVLDDIREYGGDFVIEEFDVGHEAHDPSSARITVEAPDDESLQRLLMRLQTRGVNQLPTATPRSRPLTVMACCPTGSTPPPTSRRGCASGAGGTTSATPRWTAAWSSRSRAAGGPRVRTRADVRRHPGHAHRGGRRRGPGERAQLVPLERGDELVRRSWSRTCPARSPRRCWCARWPTGCGRPGRRASGAVGGRPRRRPHRRGDRPWRRWCEAGWVDVLFAGNALATHDIETALYGTASASRSPGAAASSTATSTSSGRSTPSARPARSRARCDAGRADERHHVRVVTEREARSCSPDPSATTARCPRSSPTSSRASARCASEVRGVGFCLMMATDAALGRHRQHPARVGAGRLRRHQPGHRHQAGRPRAVQGRGIVTDVGLFLEQLALELVAD